MKTYHPDDFCMLHGYEHMQKRFGDPIPYCAECEAEQELDATLARINAVINEEDDET